MKNSILLRLLLYALITFFFRVMYIVVGYFLGFGSGSGHPQSELNLDVIFLFLNILLFWILIRFVLRPQRKYSEFTIVSSLTLVFYVLQYIYYTQF